MPSRASALAACLALFTVLPWRSIAHAEGSDASAPTADPTPTPAALATPESSTTSASAAPPESAAIPDPTAPSDTDPDATRFRALAERGRASTVRIAASGRVGAGLLVLDGTHALTLLYTVHVGVPAMVETSDGQTGLARIVAWDRLHGVALLQLDTPASLGPSPTLRAAAPVLGETVLAMGHGGSIGLSIYDEDLRVLSTFAPLPTRVVATRPPSPEQAEARVFPDFLVDRQVGDGDAGAPLFDSRGDVVGLLRGPVDGGGGRSLAVPSAVLRDLLDAPRDRRYLRPSHLQTWSGFGVAAHNRPSIIAGLLRVGVRIAILDRLRIEPWIELTLGTRAPHTLPDDEGAPVERGRDLFWSLDVGADVGYRIPIRVEGSRDYIVPNVGFRIGWNRFQQSTQALVADCPEGLACSWSTTRTLDQQREVRAGVELGLDVRHGRVRLGYRFFLDPTAPAAHSMHRLLVTFDGIPIDIAVGDSR